MSKNKNEEKKKVVITYQAICNKCDYTGTPRTSRAKADEDGFAHELENDGHIVEVLETQSSSGKV